MGVLVRQGDVVWVAFPFFERPVLIVQGDALNRTTLETVVCVELSRHVRLAQALGNVLLPAKLTGLTDDCVANVSQVVTVARSLLKDRVGHLKKSKVEAVLRGIDTMLGR